MNQIHYHLDLSVIYCESCKAYIKEIISPYFQGSFLDNANQEIFVLKDPNKKEELDELIKLETRKAS